MRLRFDRNCAFVFVHECLRGWRRCRHSLNGALGTPDAVKKVPAVPLPCHYGGRNSGTERDAPTLCVRLTRALARTPCSNV